MKTELQKVLVFILALLLSISTQAQSRGLYVWNTSSLISSPSEINILINQCKEDNITHLYVYSYNLLSGATKTQMQSFISKLQCNNINAWALDGYRGYFSDWDGPTQYYNFINAVVNYNSTVAPNERFVGIQGDNEPQDGQGEPRSSFHNDLKDSQLSTTGGGVWQATEALDREYLMRDWISITETAYTTCHNNGLLYGQAMVSWLDDYYGEPIRCTFNGQYDLVLHHILNYLDDVFIMSYSTNPATVINKMVGELQYAETLPIGSRPNIWAGLETHCGVGANVSYCDTPGKNSKSNVNTDITTIENTLKTYASYYGMNIHDWENGWKSLPSPSTDSSDPGCVLPLDLISFSGRRTEEKNFLTWTTANEINTSHFEIERSTDAISFTNIGTVEATGNTTGQKDYTYLDESAGNDLVYYRLKMVEMNGSFSYSSVIGVSEEQLKILHLFPCPAKDLISLVVYSNDEQEVNVDIYDMTGRIVRRMNLPIQKGNNRVTVDISGLPPSVYNVKLYLINSKAYTSKYFEVH